MNKTINQSPETMKDNPVTVFEMTGTDVINFLNNQVLTDLNKNTDQCKYTAICNPKGRIVFSLILKNINHTTYVAVDSELSDNFLQYINMRRFRMDFEIKKSNFSLKFDNDQKQPTVLDHVDFSNCDNHEEIGFDLFWAFIFKIKLPWITGKTTEKIIPQHVNLDTMGIIDFDKGCYPGQEIVARLHYLGKIKKRMQIISYKANGPLGLSQLVSMDGLENIDELCSPAIYCDGTWHCQAIIKT